jgi:hypothetical protein
MHRRRLLLTRVRQAFLDPTGEFFLSAQLDLHGAAAEPLLGQAGHRKRRPAPTKQL